MTTTISQGRAFKPEVLQKRLLDDEKQYFANTMFNSPNLPEEFLPQVPCSQLYLRPVSSLHLLCWNLL